MSTNKMLAEYKSLKKEVEGLRKKQKSKLKAKIDTLKREREEIITFSDNEGDEEFLIDTKRLIYFDEVIYRHFPFWISSSLFKKDGIYPFFFKLDKQIDASRTFCLKENGKYYVNIFLRISENQTFNDVIKILSSKKDIPLLPVSNESGNYESKEFLLIGININNKSNIVKHCKIVIRNKKVWLSTVHIFRNSFVENYGGNCILLCDNGKYSGAHLSSRIVRKENYPFMEIKEECISWEGKTYKDIQRVHMDNRMVFMQELFQKQNKDKKSAFQKQNKDKKSASED